MSPNEKRFFVATCLLLVGVLGWEFYRQGGLQKVFFYVLIPGLIGVLCAWLFPYWPSDDE